MVTNNQEANNSGVKKLHPIIGIGVVVLSVALIMVLMLSFMLFPGGEIILFELGFIAIGYLLLQKKPQWRETLMAQFTNHPLATKISVALVIIILPSFFVGNAYWKYNIVFACIYMIAALGLNLQLGSAGIVNLSAIAFYGVGAYTAALLSTHLGLPSAVTLIAGTIMAAVFSLFLFIPLLRTSGHYVALVTIAFQFIFVILAENLKFTGGPQGISNIPLLSFFGYRFGQSHTVFGINLPRFTDYYYAIVIVVIICILISHRIYHSLVGVTLSNIRDDEIVARVFGVDVNVWKMVVFTLGNAFMGFAGAFYAHLVGAISPYVFSFERSLVIVSIVILGGMDSIAGVVVGSFLLVLLPEKLRVIGDYRFLFYGLALIIGLLFRPQGLIPFRVRNFLGLVEKGRQPVYLEEQEVAIEN